PAVSARIERTQARLIVASLPLPGARVSATTGGRPRGGAAKGAARGALADWIRTIPGLGLISHRGCRPGRAGGRGGGCGGAGVAEDDAPLVLPTLDDDPTLVGAGRGGHLRGGAVARLRGGRGVDLLALDRVLDDVPVAGAAVRAPVDVPPTRDGDGDP